ncbi:MAG: hypothetical protein WC295_01535 [Methanoregula sp.]|jgi:hypothetical protein
MTTIQIEEEELQALKKIITDQAELVKVTNDRVAKATAVLSMSGVESAGFRLQAALALERLTIMTPVTDGKMWKKSCAAAATEREGAVKDFQEAVDRFRAICPRNIYAVDLTSKVDAVASMCCMMGVKVHVGH